MSVNARCHERGLSAAENLTASPGAREARSVSRSLLAAPAERFEIRAEEARVPKRIVPRRPSAGIAHGACRQAHRASGRSPVLLHTPLAGGSGHLIPTR